MQVPRCTACSRLRWSRSHARVLHAQILVTGIMPLDICKLVSVLAQYDLYAFTAFGLFQGRQMQKGSHTDYLQVRQLIRTALHNSGYLHVLQPGV